MTALGRKDDTLKEPWHLLPLGPVRAVLRVLAFGAAKYGAGNWQHVAEARDRYYSAALRHIAAWREGAALDLDSGEHHLAHAVCCLVFLIWFDREQDAERPTRVRA